MANSKESDSSFSLRDISDMVKEGVKEGISQALQSRIGTSSNAPAKTTTDNPNPRNSGSTRRRCEFPSPSMFK